MTEQLKKELEYGIKNKNIDSKAKKFLTIIGTSLLLLIPIGFVSGIIHDRNDYRDEAIAKVAQSWAGRQSISVPHMSFKTINEQKEEIVNELTLNNYEVTANIKTEIRNKGIFKIPVYTAEITQKGDFENKYGDLSGQQISLRTGISDSRGFVAEPSFKIGTEESKNNQDVAYTTSIKNSSNMIPFEITYKIKGLNNISIAINGNSNKVFIQGNWKDPEFKGDFLPIERKITNDGFSAIWSVPQIALPKETNTPSFVSVSLLVPVDNYSMAERALKYGFLLLSLTFLGYFIFEITSKEKRKIHPIQYCLLGTAILIFYLLLVSMSELISFNTAYLISVLMIMGIIFVYTYLVITKKQSLGFAIGITSLIGLLYAFFYVLLMLRDIALFAGSLGLFAIIAVVMYLTRNVNWYNESN